jgi:hypothetical protein
MTHCTCTCPSHKRRKTAAPKTAPKAKSKSKSRSTEIVTSDKHMPTPAELGLPMDIGIDWATADVATRMKYVDMRKMPTVYWADTTFSSVYDERKRPDGTIYRVPNIKRAFANYPYYMHYADIDGVLHVAVNGKWVKTNPDTIIIGKITER